MLCVVTWYCWLSCSACSSCCSRHWRRVSVHSSHRGWSTLELSLNMSNRDAVTFSRWDMALAWPLSPTRVNPFPFTPWHSIVITCTIHLTNCLQSLCMELYISKCFYTKKVIIYIDFYGFNNLTNNIHVLPLV